MKEDLVRRLKNSAAFTLFFFLPIIVLLALFGLLAAPLSEYLFWYAVGMVIGLPVWVTVDYLRRKREAR